MSDNGVYGPGYDFGDEWGVVYVDARCPRCRRFMSMKAGEVTVNGLGKVSLSGFRCTRCGDVTPDHEWQ